MSTTTIRVPTRVRDELNSLAQERGVSVASLVTEMTRRLRVDHIFESERQAVALQMGLDSDQRGAIDDDQALWDATLEDGLEDGLE